MSKKERRDRRGGVQDEGREPNPGRTSSLLQRLLQTFAGPSQPMREHSPAKPLPPAGRRSGTGTESIEPYLEETRSTRPGPLE